MRWQKAIRLAAEERCTPCTPAPPAPPAAGGSSNRASARTRTRLPGGRRLPVALPVADVEGLAGAGVLSNQVGRLFFLGGGGVRGADLISSPAGAGGRAPKAARPTRKQTAGGERGGGRTRS